MKFNQMGSLGFDKPKELCTSAPILAYADFQKLFRLYTDVSILPLEQFYIRNKRVFEKAVSYASWSLSKSESKYAVHKLEFLCLKWAITDQFHEYLYGNTFDIYTDNYPLMYVLSSTKLDAMGHRWIAGLANYNFHIHYKSGKSNVEADALSRIDWEKCNETIYVDSIQAIVTAVIAGDLVNMEAVSCSTQMIEPFLLIQSEPAAISKAITQSSNQSHMTCPEHEPPTTGKVVNADDSGCLTTGKLENKLNPRVMTTQDLVEAQSKDKIISKIVHLFKPKK